MKNWNAIQQELARHDPPAAPGSREEFWADFAARARFVAQESPRPTRRPVLWASMAATAGAAALLAFLLWPSPVLADVTRVTSLEVGLPHSAAMILNVVSENGQEAGALVWVSGLEESP